MSRAVSSSLGGTAATFNETLIPDVSKLKTESADEQPQHFSQVLLGQENASQQLASKLGNGDLSQARATSVTSLAKPLNSDITPSLFSSALPTENALPSQNSFSPSPHLPLNYYQQYQAKVAQPSAAVSQSSYDSEAGEISEKVDDETPETETASASAATTQQALKMATFSTFQIFASQLQTAPGPKAPIEDKKESAIEGDESVPEDEEEPCAAPTTLLGATLKSSSFAKSEPAIANNESPSKVVEQPKSQQNTPSAPSSALIKTEIAPPVPLTPQLSSQNIVASPGQNAPLEDPPRAPVLAQSEVAAQSPTTTAATLLNQTKPASNVLERESQTAPNATSSKPKKAAESSTNSGTASANIGTFSSLNWLAMNMSLNIHKSLPNNAAGNDSTPSSISNSGAKEKMSSSSSLQGTFFHADVATNSAIENASQFVGENNQNLAQFSTSQIVHSQPVTITAQTSPQISANQHAIPATALGTTRANEKSVTGKAESDMSVNAQPLSTLNSMTPSKPQILSHNSEFHGVMKQIMAQVTSDPAVTALSPRRVSVEIQTPPGAIVNVYISRQNDQFRAQLSTADPQALKWVQDQVSVLQQSPETAGSVQWLPAQMEGQTNDSASGQGQRQDQPTPDERNPQQKAPQENPEEDFMTINKKVRGGK